MNYLDYSNDLDWYAKDNNKIAHFATGGTDTFPNYFINEKDHWEKVCMFFNELPINENKIISICEENLPDFDSLQDREMYLRSFIQMAKKGLYSHDIDFEKLNYKLIAFPLDGNIEIPTCILDLLPNINDVI